MFLLSTSAHSRYSARCFPLPILAEPTGVLLRFSVAILLEYLQTLAPDRHGTLIDAYEKILGGALGVFACPNCQLFAVSRGHFLCGRIRGVAPLP